MIASSSKDSTVKLWKLDGTMLQTFAGHNDAVTSVSFSPDGKMIASASKDKTIKLWSIDGTEIKTFNEHIDTVLGVSFSPDGKTLTSVSGNNTVVLRNLGLDDLVVRGCNWLRDYLKTHPNVSEKSRPFCK